MVTKHMQMLGRLLKKGELRVIAVILAIVALLTVNAQVRPPDINPAGENGLPAIALLLGNDNANM